MNKSINSIDYCINHPICKWDNCRFKNDGRKSSFKIYDIKRNYSRIGTKTR